MQVPGAESDHERCSRADPEGLSGDTEGDSLVGAHPGGDQDRRAGPRLDCGAGGRDRQHRGRRRGADEGEGQREVRAEPERGQEDEDGERP